MKTRSKRMVFSEKMTKNEKGRFTSGKKRFFPGTIEHTLMGEICPIGILSHVFIKVMLFLYIFETPFPLNESSRYKPATLTELNRVLEPFKKNYFAL